MCLNTSTVASSCRSNELSLSVGPYSNDIGLIKVRALSDNGIRFNSHVRPICLPELQAKGTTGSWCSVTGWGAQRREYSRYCPSSEILNGSQHFFTPRIEFSSF